MADLHWPHVLLPNDVVEGEVATLAPSIRAQAHFRDDVEHSPLVVAMSVVIEDAIVSERT